MLSAAKHLQVRFESTQMQILCFARDDSSPGYFGNLQVGAVREPPLHLVEARFLTCADRVPRIERL